MHATQHTHFINNINRYAALVGYTVNMKPSNLKHRYISRTVRGFICFFFVSFIKINTDDCSGCCKSCKTECVCTFLTVDALVVKFVFPSVTKSQRQTEHESLLAFSDNVAVMTFTFLTNLLCY